MRNKESRPLVRQLCRPAEINSAVAAAFDQEPAALWGVYCVRHRGAAGGALELRSALSGESRFLVAYSHDDLIATTKRVLAVVARERKRHIRRQHVAAA